MPWRNTAQVHQDSGPAPYSPEAVRDGMWLSTDRILHRDEVPTRQLHAVVGTRLTNTDTRLHPFAPSFRTNKTKLCYFRDTRMGVTMLKIKAVNCHQVRMVVSSMAEFVH